MMSASALPARSRLAVLLLCTCAVLFFTACGEQRKVEVPKERASLLLEILTDLDMKKYEEVLPKIYRFQTIDDTNAFLTVMETVVITNIYAAKAREALEKGDFKKANDIMKESFLKYESHTDRVNLEQFTKKLVEADSMIASLGTEQMPETMLATASELKRVAANLPASANITQYAERKMRDAVELDKLIRDRRFLWLYFSAQDARANGETKDADVQAALLAAGLPRGDHEGMVLDLMNGGMFDRNDPPEATKKRE